MANSFFAKLQQGLSKTRDNIAKGMDSVFYGSSNIDEDFYEELEETLIMGDIGINATSKIMDELRRGVTKWEGIGAYTNEDSHVIVTVISKYEEAHLREIIAGIDPGAFMVITDNIRVAGNFEKRFTE